MTPPRALSFCLHDISFDAFTDAVHVVDRDLNILLHNRIAEEWAAQFGFAVSTGKMLQEVFPFLPQNVIEEYRWVFESGTIHVSSESFDLGGRIIHTETRKVPLFEIDKVAHVMTIIRDVTAQRQAEEALLQSEQKYRLLVENSTDIVIMLGPDFAITYISRAVEPILGYKPEALLNRSCLDFLHPDDVPAVIDALSWAFNRPGTEKAVEHRLRHQDGSWHFFHSSGMSTTDCRGEAVVVVNARDVSDRKQTEEQLRASEERYRALVESSSDAILLLTVERDIASCNRAFLELFGYNRAEVEGASIRIVHPSDESYTDYGAAAYPCIEKQNYFRTEWTFARKDGTTFPAESATSVMRARDGSVSGYVSIIRDISRRKEAERALKESEERYRTIFENTGTATALVEENTIISLGNSEMEKLTGCTKEEIEGKRSWTEFVPEEDLEKLLEYHKTRRKDADQAPRKFECRLKIKDGSVKHVLITVDVIPGTKTSVCSMLDITEQRRVEETIRQLAYYDVVTTLPNRVLFDDRIKVALAQAERQKKKLAVMMLDLDRFKEINDALGHKTGDDLLSVVGKRLMAMLRKSDTVARMGGDEFMFLFPSVASKSVTEEIAGKIIKGFRDPFRLNGHSLPVTASIGVAIYPDDGRDSETLMRHADSAMYRAKADGRNKYIFFSEGQ